MVLLESNSIKVGGFGARETGQRDEKSESWCNDSLTSAGGCKVRAHDASKLAVIWTIEAVLSFPVALLQPVGRSHGWTSSEGQRVVLLCMSMAVKWCSSRERVRNYCTLLSRSQVKQESRRAFRLMTHPTRSMPEFTCGNRELTEIGINEQIKSAHFTILTSRFTTLPPVARALAIKKRRNLHRIERDRTRSSEVSTRSDRL